MPRHRFITAALSLSFLLWGCAGETEQAAEPRTEPPVASPTEVSVEPNRQVLFGDVHLHSNWSFDAYSLAVLVGPEEAYRFARGEAIAHIGGGTIQLAGPPLDFMALTEHAEYMGVSASLAAGDETLKRVDLIARLTSDDTATRSSAIIEFAANLRDGEPNPELITDEIMKPTWRRLVEYADEHNEPGKFTAFAGFEWTSMADGNLHRNLIFRGNNVPDRVFSAFDSLKPEDLWTWMEATRENYDDVLAIPHNANMSDGQMYPLIDSNGDPLSAAWAARRNFNEPVTEVMQIKGHSETHPILSPNDEWADFELYHRSLADMTGESIVPKAPGSYARHALKDGIRLSEELGTNPYHMGMIGSTDGHNGAGPTEEKDYFGKLGVADGTPAQRLNEGMTPFIPDVVARWSASGLAAVWAESNTRESIFDAMRRRETYATSGTRIRLRFFAGDLADIDPTSKDAVEQAYAVGVPMGGSVMEGTPVFLMMAARDPLSAPIDRLQVIKGWVENGEAREEVIDIACREGEPSGDPMRCPGQEAPSDEDCEALVAAEGAAELRASWRDPSFNPDTPAFYYARVLETHTCRWSLMESRKSGFPVPEDIPGLIQERAVSSPIWTGR